MPPDCKHEDPTVLIIDDDLDVREALQTLFRSVGLRAEAFASVQEFRQSDRQNDPGCLVLDIRLPGQSGLEFFEDERKLGVQHPVIFISGHADIAMSVRAMKAGAFEFLTKPVRDQDLLDAVQLAIQQDRVQREAVRNDGRIRVRFESLTLRERNIMTLVVQGRRNKQIAADIGVSEATVKFHRGHLMRKMQAHSLTDLVRMADTLGVSRQRS